MKTVIKSKYTYVLCLTFDGGVENACGRKMRLHHGNEDSMNGTKSALNISQISCALLTPSCYLLFLNLASVMHIGDEAFASSHTLREVTMWAGLQSMGEYVFCNLCLLQLHSQDCSESLSPSFVA